MDRLPFLLLSLLTLVTVTTAQPRSPPTTCRRSCKGIDLPYPFGIIGDPEDCYMLPDFGFTCDDSYYTPIYRNKTNRIPVVGVYLPQGSIRVLMALSRDCYNSSGRVGPRLWGMSMENTPYTMSYTRNIFTAVGCDTWAQIKIGNNNFGGCISGCNTIDNVADGRCSGIGCCEASIPQGVKWYNANFTARSNSSNVTLFNNCSYSFLVEKDTYTFRRSNLTYIDVRKTMLPLILDWVVGNHSCEEALKNRSSYACVSSDSYCINSNNVPGYFCNCSEGFNGNPYLQDGCQDIDECKLDKGQYPCYGICTNIAGGYNCTCPEGFYSDDPKKRECVVISSPSNQGLTLGPKLVIGIGTGLFSIFVLISLIYLGLQKRKLKKMREMFFQQNGGTFLQQTLSSLNRNTFKIFSMEELESATNKFSKDHILGRGGFGTVYKGKLSSGTLIAVKKSSIMDEKKNKEFANEMFIISQINHKNIVKLLGCCLEVEIPMLVYEYIPNGTLFNLLHNKRPIIPFPFSNRMKIATEAAHALKYLHTDASPPILHGDVKSSNILLDENYIAKVSDFGTSTMAPKDKTEFTTLVQGTYGYLDPEYLQTSQLSDKSDVYSFGVVLVELLTRRMPFNFSGPEAERSLAFNFISCLNENRLVDILDIELVRDGLTENVQKVATLAMCCLNLKREERPAMRDIMIELEGLEGLEIHPWVTVNQDMISSMEPSTSYSHDVSAEYELWRGR